MPELSRPTPVSRATVTSAALLTAFITFLVFLPALDSDFVNWDDRSYVYENELIHSIDEELLKRSFTTFYFANWHPLTSLSHAIDYALWGLDPRGHHLTSVLFHCLNTFLVALLVIRLAGLGGGGGGLPSVPGKKIIAAGVLTALLFGIHPLHVESVAWVSERKDVLSALFYLLAVIAYLNYAESRRQSRPFFYGASLILFIMALMSKPMAVTLPLVLIILDFYPLGRLTKEGALRAVFEKAPFFVLGLMASVAAVWAQHSTGALAALEGHLFMERVFVALHGYIFYLYKMVIPTGLAPLYQMPLQIDFFSFQYMASLAAFLFITIFCVYSLKRYPLFSAAWLYYVVTLLPVIGIVQVGAQYAADRYTYLPSLGPFILAGFGAGVVFERCPKKVLPALLVFSVLVSGVLLDRTVRQIAVWRNSVTLWSHEIELYPDSAHPGYYNRGNAYLKLGIYEKAIKDFDRDLRLNPSGDRAYKAYNNRGTAYAGLGDTRQAIKDFKTALELNPQHAKTYFNLAMVYSGLGESELALESYKKAAGLGLNEARDYLIEEGVVD
jgi:hypothetical protein